MVHQAVFPLLFGFAYRERLFITQSADIHPGTLQKMTRVPRFYTFCATLIGLSWMGFISAPLASRTGGVRINLNPWYDHDIRWSSVRNSPIECFL